MYPTSRSAAAPRNLTIEKTKQNKGEDSRLAAPKGRLKRYAAMGRNCFAKRRASGSEAMGLSHRNAALSFFYANLKSVTKCKAPEGANGEAQAEQNCDLKGMKLPVEISL